MAPESFFVNSLGRMREIYAHVAIYPQTTSHSGAEALLAKGDSRIQKVFSASGKDFCYVIDRSFAGENANLGQFKPQDMQAACASFPRTDDTVRVFIVKQPYNDNNLNGYAYPDVDQQPPLAGACGTKCDDNPNMTVVAHEVGYLLTNKSVFYGLQADLTMKWADVNSRNSGGGHFARPKNPPDNRYIHFHNLMGGSRFRLWEVWVEEGYDNTREINSKVPQKPEPGNPTGYFNQYLSMRLSPFLRKP
jgi:hypothetical protein